MTNDTKPCLITNANRNSMVGAGLLINLLAPLLPPKKRRKSSQAKARADQEIFSPEGKKISWSPKLFIFYYGKGKKHCC